MYCEDTVVMETKMQHFLWNREGKWRFSVRINQSPAVCMCARASDRKQHSRAAVNRRSLHRSVDLFKLTGIFLEQEVNFQWTQRLFFFFFMFFIRIQSNSNQTVKGYHTQYSSPVHFPRMQCVYLLQKETECRRTETGVTSVRIPACDSLRTLQEPWRVSVWTRMTR